MSFIKLDVHHQKFADELYDIESKIISKLDSFIVDGSNRWLAIGKTDLEKAFMSLRKGVTEKFKDANAPITNK